MRFPLNSLIALLAVATAAPVAAQSTGGLAGVVRDSATARPIADVQVSVRNRAATTDGAGRWRLEQLPVGPAAVPARRTGYRPVKRATTVVAATTVQLDVTMAEAATTLTPIVVSATRDRRSLAEVPVAVSVADETTIQSGRTAGLHEVLRLTPGVQATSRLRPR
ncbi:MAG: carboxypeptidase regulatory-like domain-containing protein [Gemmatimonadetes bacterium]|nr:carboxypeptidase regulatory-like domain-containing protein [Gemmatimonadota bacterium]